jgi:hypothetical protein
MRSRRMLTKYGKAKAARRDRLTRIGSARYRSYDPTLLGASLAWSSRFDEIYPEDGRRSIPPERLLRALLLQLLYSVAAKGC